METPTAVLELGPLRCLSLNLPRLESGFRRAALRGVLALSGGAVRVEGADRLAAAPEPSIFALTHHNVWEALLAPAALMAARRGRPVRFLIDWMFVDLPWTGWLLRRFAPIPVYAKPARFRLRERHRRERRRDSAFDAAVAALGEGQDVGLYSEGRRNPDPWLLGAPRRGLARLALRAGAPVVPIGIDFPARDRLQRTPRAGRLVLRVGEPLSFGAEHAAWRDAPSGGERRRVEKRLGPEIADRVHEELARLARKVYVRRSRPEKEATVAGAAIASGLSVARSWIRRCARPRWA